MNALAHDIGYAFRTLLNRPGFTAIVVLTLALGIGANTAVFTVTKGVLLHSPPVAEPDRVFSVLGARDDGSVDSQYSYPTYLELRERCTAFSDLSVSCSQPAHVGTAEHAERLQTDLVSGNYFTMLGVLPAIGRLFTESDDVAPGGHPVAVLSYSSWMTRFAGDPAIAGKQITLNGRPFSVNGVAAKGFQGITLGRPIEIWVPAVMYDAMNPTWAQVDALHNRDFRTFGIIGRLAPDVPVQGARDQLTSISRELHNEGLSGFSGGKFISLLQSTIGMGQRAAVSTYMRLLFVIVGLVLLIACANVANMLMARTLDRRRELAIRGALGAGRWRITRQLLTESVVLAILGGGLGLVASTWITDLLVLLVPEGELLSRASIDLTLDTSVYVSTLGIAVVTGCALGLTPAVQAMSLNLVSTLKGQSDTGRSGRRWFTFPNVLVAGQVAVSLLLLVTAGLLVQTLANMRKTDPGFQPANTLLASVDLRRQGYDVPAQQAFQKRILQRVRALPGVVSVGLAGAVPPHNRASLDLSLRGVRGTVESSANVACNMVSPDYFSTMRIPLLAGRTFDDRDTEGEQNVAVINATMATKYWDNYGSALGQKFQLMGKTFDIVGIVEDSIYHDLREEFQPFTYFALSQVHMFVSTITMVTRTTDHPMAQVSALRSAVGELDPALPLFDIRTLDDHLGAAMSQERVLAWSSGVFSILALVLTGTGLFGVMSSVVSRRVREIGLRMAVGAQRGDVLRLVIKRGLSLVAAGLGIGLLLSLGSTRVLLSRLYEISPVDPATLLGVSLLLAAVALLACFIPALRATQVDPMVALRCD